MAWMQDQRGQPIQRPKCLQQCRANDTLILENGAEGVVYGFNKAPNDSSAAIRAVKGSMEIFSTSGSLAWQTTMRGQSLLT